MNIILYLHTAIRACISNYVTEVMSLSTPTICPDLSLLADLYKKSRPTMFIISASLYADRSMKKMLADLLKIESCARLIIIPDKPKPSDQKFAQKLKAAIMFCQDEPSRIMTSICLAGITIAEHCNNPGANSQTRIGVKRINMEDIIYGHPYTIITETRPYQRYIYRSKNKGTILAGIDQKLTPDEYKGRTKLHEIPKTDILSIMKICYELREF